MAKTRTFYFENKKKIPWPTRMGILLTRPAAAAATNSKLYYKIIFYGSKSAQ
jgi:hypothetical protein